jgi:flagellar basal-body rod modification protein FlgD
MTAPIEELGLGLGVPPAKRKSDLGQEDFLRLMLTQLKNQDPFKPMESGEFLGQLAQFGTVQGLATLKTSFDGLASSLVSNQALQAATLVGRSALVEASELAIEPGRRVEGAVNLPAASSGVMVEIRDAKRQTVRTLELGPQAEGLATFVWDGLDDDGDPVPAGSYTFKATYRSESQTIAAEALLRAPIDSVLLDADGFSVELRGIGELPFTAVREIRDGTAAAAPGADAN